MFVDLERTAINIAKSITTWQQRVTMQTKDCMLATRWSNATTWDLAYLTRMLHDIIQIPSERYMKKN